MSSIFISHSSKDNAWAERIAAWLEQQSYGSLFLDFDPEQGIVAGSDWRKTLYQKLRLSRVLIALCSENFLASELCLLEVAIAMDQGKDPIPLQIDPPLQNDPPGELPKLLQHIQAIDFRTNSEMGFQQLARAPGWFPSCGRIPPAGWCYSRSGRGESLSRVKPLGRRPLSLSADTQGADLLLTDGGSHLSPGRCGSSRHHSRSPRCESTWT